jgi:hypothetical protein
MNKPASDKSSAPALAITPRVVPARTLLASLFIVMTEAVEGKEDEFNDWYTNIHCHDTMRLKGSVAVQRWKLSPYQLLFGREHFGPPHRWLCIYELGDTQQNIDDHVAQCFSDAMPITSAQRIDLAEDFYYVPVASGQDAVATYGSRGGGIITVRMNAAAGREAEFAKWYREQYLPRTLKLAGFLAGDLYRAADIQLIAATPPFTYTAVYHVEDEMVAIESLDSHLAQPGTILDCPFVDRTGVRIACYTPITNRFTAAQALNLPPAQKAIEDRIRANMGDRRHYAEAPGGLKIKRD